MAGEVLTDRIEYPAAEMNWAASDQGTHSVFHQRSEQIAHEEGDHAEHHRGFQAKAAPQQAGGNGHARVSEGRECVVDAKELRAQIQTQDEQGARHRGNAHHEDREDHGGDHEPQGVRVHSLPEAQVCCDHGDEAEFKRSEPQRPTATDRELIRRPNAET